MSTKPRPKPNGDPAAQAVAECIVFGGVLAARTARRWRRRWWWRRASTRGGVCGGAASDAANRLVESDENVGVREPPPQLNPAGSNFPSLNSWLPFSKRRSR